MSSIFLIKQILSCFLSVDQIREIVVPQLAESLSEGDIRWEKGESLKCSFSKLQ